MIYLLKPRQSRNITITKRMLLSFKSGKDEEKNRNMCLRRKASHNLRYLVSGNHINLFLEL